MNKKRKKVVPPRKAAQRLRSAARRSVEIEDILESLARFTGPISMGSGEAGTFGSQMTDVLSKIGRLVRCSVGSIWVISPQSGNLQGLATFGYRADISDIEYELGKKTEGSHIEATHGKERRGITAHVATKTPGESLWFNSAIEVKAHPAWAGKVDKKQWRGRRRFRNCGIIPLDVGHKRIGVWKMENFSPSPILAEKRRTVESLAPFIAQALDSYRRHLVPGEKQFRMQPPPYKFEVVELGNVLLEHVLTSICASDVKYYLHEKSKEKLAERLPMVLGHETVGIVREVGLRQSYSPAPSTGTRKSERITVGDYVVVIPQIPCGVCPTCRGSRTGTTDEVGENYCENVRHMASNADGSLRTKYRWEPDLLIRYNPQEIPNKLAVMTELFAQLVQVLRELGFMEGREGFDVSIERFGEIMLSNAFSIPPGRFDSYFRIFASEDQVPRSMLRLPNEDKDLLRGVSNGRSVSTNRTFSHYSLMRRGLFLSALRAGARIRKRSAKVLLLGTGPAAFIAALLLREAYGLSEEQVYIYGRRNESLEHFRKHELGRTINGSMPEVDGKPIVVDMKTVWEKTGVHEPSGQPGTTGTQPGAAPQRGRSPFSGAGGLDDRTVMLQPSVTKHLQGEGVTFDVVLECVGGRATENLVNFAIDNASERGIIGLFGLSEEPINVDFAKVLRKELTFKGFFRACRGSYFEALEYLKKKRVSGRALELVPREAWVVGEASDLNKAFDESASSESKHWGKVLVELADTRKPIV